MPLSWLARCWRYLMANPIVGLVGALIAAVGIGRVRVRHLESKAAKAQADADLARLKLSRQAAAERDKAHTAKQAEVTKTIAEAEAKGEAGSKKAKRASERLKDISKRWPTTILLLVALWGPLWASEEACQDQPDMTGLAQALEGSEARFKGLDALMVKDAAASLRAYADMVSGLCVRLETTMQVADSAHLGRRLALDELDRCGEDRSVCWTEQEARLKRPVIVRKAAFLSCVAGGLAGVSMDGEAAIGLGLACGVTVWP